MRINVLEYDPAWPKEFERFKRILESALDGVPYISIEHVGSTSVPGLPAKPIIDVDIIVQPAQLQAVIDALTSKGGFDYKGEWGVPGRHAFRWPGFRNPKPDELLNLYACIEGCPALRNHLAIRDTCRQNAQIRDKYGLLKLELAKREWLDGDEYCEAKTELLTWILQQAGMSQEETKEIELHSKRVP